MEIELKLSLAPADVAALRRHPLLKQYALGKPLTRQFSNTYFDTPDQQLRRHDAALRLRRAAGARGWTQTLKAGGQVISGLHQRDEWESPVDGSMPDLATLRALVGGNARLAKAISRPGLAEALLPIFTTRFRRSGWQLRLAHGEEVEFTLDQGTVERGASRQAICEIELELKSGDPAALFDFALQLQDTVPLRVSNISKAERGYALLDPQPPAVVKASEPVLSPKLSAAQGLQLIVENCLAHIQGNEAGVELGSDAESVHQMRVGLRRLRSILGLFTSIAPCPAALRAELQWLNGILGVARDWEVLVGVTLSMAANACPDQDAFNRLLRAAQARALRSRQAAARAVGSLRYARLMLELGGWLLGARWRATPVGAEPGALQAPLMKFASRLLERCHRKLHRHGERLRKNTMPHAAANAAQRRHRVRIAAKKLRYATGIFQSLYPARRVHAYVGRLADLQDALGTLNDVAVGDGLLNQLVQRQPGLAHGAGCIQGYLAARSEREIRQLDQRWRQYAAIKLPGVK